MPHFPVIVLIFSACIILLLDRPSQSLPGRIPVVCTLGFAALGCALPPSALWALPSCPPWLLPQLLGMAVSPQTGAEARL